VSIDLVDPDIHPPFKRAVGERLARWALADSYGRDLQPSGPLFEKIRIEGNTVFVSFTHSESGLMIARKVGLGDVEETPGVPLTLFEVANDKGEWHQAEATIAERELQVRSAAAAAPVAVRYAYAVSPTTCHLYNRDGLPAAPFCSNPDLLHYSPTAPPISP
jgi:sialate O-acetylesterase